MTAIDDTSIDWLPAIRDTVPYYLNPPADLDDQWVDWMRHQLGRALWYLTERVNATATDTSAVCRRAAIILNAEPQAPDLERNLGIRINLAAEGRQVKCRNSACRKKWVAIPEDPYYDGTTAGNGICTACMLKETRTDDAVPVIEGVPVAAKRTRRSS